ncbi:ABC transporter substrate-binding protein [Limobrevibacterium gyesilva]|uniref:ABC transporter substrate-binding protein n=1 Tax=Limobrevibacterium gyesilva TaxID=2991712 RepID=A0AA42CHI7_9PROT|nr:ABC transporter substrate-binding protein [Limobrevibacterium gyesilva]MCW3474905.1 ABC transporter substrate-binding protein [Limobrevibacterium gyesilva]
MPQISRRAILAGSAAMLAIPTTPHAQGAGGAKPKVTVISQWSAGSDGAAITTLGKEFERQGGIWEHNPVPGFTTEMMNKLRAQIIAGDPPAASQLKGPEIAAWSKVGAVVNLDEQVKEAGYEAVVPAELARLSKPNGHWIALPIQAYRINTLFVSKKAADRIGMTSLPTTWSEFNAAAEKMKAAGITPVANGGIKWDDGMKWEIALCGISPDAYRKAVMELDAKTLQGPEVLAAFRQFRKLGEWSDPGSAGQHYSTFIPRYMKGDMGMLLMGGWAQGVFKNAGFQLSDYMVGPAPQDDGKVAFDLNADEFIFWQKKQPEFQQGQKLLAKIVMGKAFGPMYSQITGSLPVRTDTDLSDPGFSDGQREAARAMSEAVKANRVVLSLAHNMAQTNQIAAAMIDVLTEYVHDNRIKAEEGQKRLVEAVDSIR